MVLENAADRELSPVRGVINNQKILYCPEVIEPEHNRHPLASSLIQPNQDGRLR
jgi:hypothetical protein